jgi:hypothetical protein
VRHSGVACALRDAPQDILDWGARAPSA